MADTSGQELKRERERLNALVDRALADGTPLSETFEIMRQSEKVNRLISEIEREEQSIEGKNEVFLIDENNQTEAFAK
jgi:hypothetical protein